MTRPATVAVFLLAAVVAGCASTNGSNGDRTGPAAAEKDHLRLELQVSDHELAVGDTFTVHATARNTGAEPIGITARSGALLIVRIWQETPVGWTTVKRYPEAAIMVIQPWTLAPGEQRAFEMKLTVGKDWPTAETLRLSAELNGRNDVRATTDIRITGSGEPSHD
jgi:hypothetical protein